MMLLHSAPYAPPCARYEGGEDDPRLLAVWTYVAGLAGGSESAKELSAKIARLYDYKGQLIIATRKPLVPAHENMFREAWKDVGSESLESVEFIDVHSNDWDTYWGFRRFDSDWKP